MTKPWTTERSRFLRTVCVIVFVCPVFVLGALNISLSFLENHSHPEWDFFLRYGEVSCLVDYGIDPYDVYSGKIRNDIVLPFCMGYTSREDVLDHYWVCGYPPWEYSLMILFKIFPFFAADAIYRGVELIALIGIVWLSFRRQRPISKFSFKSFALGFAVLLLPPLAWKYAFDFGNWSIPFCFAAIVFVYFLQHDRPIPAGLAWAFLMIKPQQGIWFAIPLLFRRQFKTFFIAVSTCILASIPPAFLCGKSPIALILEIPKFRFQPYIESSFFPPAIYERIDAWLFPRAALAIGAVLCLSLCVFGSWKLRKGRDWFVFLQPTFFCVCAGYPLWPQDWLYFFFPISFLLETSLLRKDIPLWIRSLAILLVVGLANPVSWVQFDFLPLFDAISPQEVLSMATWSLFAFLVFWVFRAGRQTFGSTAT